MDLLEERERQRMEATIMARAREFEVPALLRALRYAGYKDDAIELHSNPCLGFTASLVESVEFFTTPERHAVVTLNRGLLSNQGALPSYFWEILAAQRESLMYEFLWFFDDVLMSLDYQAREPENDASVLHNLTHALGDLLRLLRLHSPHGLHWLFQVIFPELEVYVRRAPSVRTLEVTRARVSKSELGAGSAMLGFAQIPSGGLIVTLLADESTTPRGELWGAAAESRLQQLILPRLRGTDLLLTVILCVRDHYEHLQLSDTRHLAYGVLDGQGGVPNLRPVHRLILFNGAVDAAKQ